MKLVFLVSLLIFSSLSFSQKTQKNNGGQQIITLNTQRYKIDFEIEDFNLTTQSDSILVNQIDLNSMEESRLESDDIEIEIEINTIEYTIILYSVYKAGLKKGQHGLELETE